MKREELTNLYDKRREDIEDKLIKCKTGTGEYHRLISEYNRLAVMIAKIEERVPKHEDTKFRGGFKYY